MCVQSDTAKWLPNNTGIPSSGSPAHSQTIESGEEIETPKMIWQLSFFLLRHMDTLMDAIRPGGTWWRILLRICMPTIRSGQQHHPFWATVTMVDHFSAAASGCWFHLFEDGTLAIPSVQKCTVSTQMVAIPDWSGPTISIPIQLCKVHSKHSPDIFLLSD